MTIPGSTFAAGKRLFVTGKMWPRLFELYGTVEVRRGRFTVSAAGLVYARMVVEKHGGTVGFEYNATEGTDLVVRFPR